jgi:hypothetical protein
MAKPTQKPRKHKWLTFGPSASADIFRTNKVHKGLSASLSEENDVVPLGSSPFHSRRPGRHAGDGQSDGGRSFFQESSDGYRRDMSFQHVPIDLSGVASRKIGWHPQPSPDRLKICGLLNRNSEAGILQMPHPARAATAIWIFMNQDRGGLGFGGIPLQNEKGGDQTERTSPRHLTQFVRHVDSPLVA